MNELSLDGRLLKLFLVVYETTSVTEAAYRLDVTQSTVSHALSRLRKITGDPLFVASGRGIVPTPRAHVLANQAEDLLIRLARFATAENYDPLTDDGVLAIASYDYEIETIIRLLFPILRQKVPNLTLRVVRAHGQTEWIQVLRGNKADLVLSLALENPESDLNQQILFEDRYMCFYDPSKCSGAPDLDTYIAAPQALITTDGLRPNEVDRALKAIGVSRRVVLEAPNFGTLASLISGTDIITTMPSRLKDSLFSGLAFTEPPLEMPCLQIAQIWHNRNTTSERHQWFRKLISDVMKAPSEINMNGVADLKYKTKK